MKRSSSSGEKQTDEASKHNKRQKKKEAEDIFEDSEVEESLEASEVEEDIFEDSEVEEVKKGLEAFEDEEVEDGEEIEKVVEAPDDEEVEEAEDEVVEASEVDFEKESEVAAGNDDKEGLVEKVNLIMKQFLLNYTLGRAVSVNNKRMITLTLTK
jgi:hypothetical protein